MLDLKAKLAAAGLVSKEDIERAERAKKPRGNAKRDQAPKAPESPRLPFAQLRGKPKGEIYDAVRRFVDKVRLDPAGAAPSEAARTFHFAQANGKVGRLVLEPDIVAQLEDGRAGLVAFMSHHGLAHAVVPAACAGDIAEVMPLWLRVLIGDTRAGALANPEIAK